MYMYPVRVCRSMCCVEIICSATLLSHRLSFLIQRCCVAYSLQCGHKPVATSRPNVSVRGKLKVTARATYAHCQRLANIYSGLSLQQ